MKHFITILFSLLFVLGANAENLIQNPGFESTTAKWRTYCDAAGTTPVDGINGGVAGFALTSSTTSPLDEKASGIITKDAANRQGCGISTDFTAKTAKVYQINFNYKITSGTYTEDSLKVYLYDVTNASMIEVAPTYVKNSGFEETFAGSVQTTTGTSYRLIIHNASTNATAFTLKIDGFSFGQNPKSFGTTITDWTSYTPTGAWTTATAYVGRYRRVGDHIEVQAKVSTSGTPDTADLYVGIPSICTIDTSKLAGTSVSDVLGVAEILDSGVRVYAGVVAYRNTSTLSVIHTESGNSGIVNQASPIAFGAADVVSMKFSVPCVGMSATSQLLSSDAGTRLLVINAIKSGNKTIPGTATETVIDSWTVNNDTTGSFNGTTGIFTAPQAGFYDFEATNYYQMGATATGQLNIHWWKNDTATRLSYQEQTNGVANKGYTDIVSAKSVFLNAGDTVRLKSYSSNQAVTYGGSLSYIFIKQVQGPAQVMASESVSANYTGAPPTGTLNGSFNIVTFGTKIKDSHNAYSGGSYSVPSSGVYDISAAVETSGTFTTNGSSLISIFVDGVEKYRSRLYTTYTAGVTYLFPSINVRSIPLLTGQVVTIRASCDATSPTYGSSLGNFFSITKTGNY